MRPSSEAVKADLRRRMRPPQRQSVARIAEALGVHWITPYKWEEGLTIAEPEMTDIKSGKKRAED